MIDKCNKNWMKEKDVYKMKNKFGKTQIALKIS